MECDGPLIMAGRSVTAKKRTKIAGPYTPYADARWGIQLSLGMWWILARLTPRIFEDDVLLSGDEPKPYLIKRFQIDQLFPS
jgi:hypothetical protein